MSFEIVTDSCCNLNDDMIDECNLHILPMRFTVDGVEYVSYIKGQQSTYKKFYDMLREGKVITTSMPSLHEAETLFRSLLDEGRDLIYIGFSSGLSGTFHAISTLLDDLAGQYPDRKVYAVDTLAASCGVGMLCWYAAQMRAEGYPIEEVRDWLEANKLHVAHWFTVDDLMFLFRGGRVSRTSAWAGTLLKIKPILHVDDEGHLIPMEKVRGRKKSLTAIVDHLAASGIEPIAKQKLFIVHGDSYDEALDIKAMLEDRCGAQDITICELDPVIAGHSGPGTMAVFFLADQR